MRERLLDILVCPACKRELDLRARSRAGMEVMEGDLRCRGCGAAYAVTRWVPRFVDRSAYASSFGYQWRRFRRVQLDAVNGTGESERALARTTGWENGEYRGRWVLDAGAGAGRFADVIARKGGEVVGVDVTSAIDAAYANLSGRERVHLVQADIYALPFRDGTFDLAYSIGVLHHTPDPRAAFARVAAAVRTGGSLAVYVYPAYGPGYRCSDQWRKVTTRLPLRLMAGVAAAAIPLYYVYRLPILGKLLHLLAPISLHPHWRWRWLDTFDWYTPRYQWKFFHAEVFGWFRACGFREIDLFEPPIRMRGVKADPSGGRA